MVIKDIIEQHKNVILELHRRGYKKAEITNKLITLKNLEIPFDKVDSLRRSISHCIKSNLNAPEVFNNEIVPAQDNDNDDTVNDDFDDALKGAYEHKEKFWYVSEADSYYFNIPGYKPGMKLSGTLIRSMKNMYSKVGRGGGLTINEICRAVKLPREIIIYVKTYLGWTHDQDPYTNEEILSTDLDDLVDRTLEDRKFQWYQKYTRKEQREIADAANKWYQLKGNVIKPFTESMIAAMNEYHAKPVTKIEARKGSPYALVVGPFDLHFGKYAWNGDTGNTYNKEIAREALINSTRGIIGEVIDKNIEKVVIPIGSDFFHVDTINGTTTRGTPQDTDGTLVQIMVEGNRLMVEFIDMLRSVANVELILAAGNHDYVLSHQLLEHLAAYYRNCNDVEVKRCYHFRQYTTYGNCLLGFTHGDETKLSELPMLMANEAKNSWAQAKHKAFFTGHLHHEMCKDFNGVKVYQMPSLAGTDRWHHKKGYTGSIKGMGAYLVHKEKGVRITVMENL